MPWQLSGNGRSDWSTKLIRGLKAEAAAGFQSRRERCREPTPVTPQYAAFSTYKAAGFYRAVCLVLLMVYDRPFGVGGFALQPTVLRDIMPD